MKKVILLLLILSAILTAQKLTLRQSIELGLKNSKDLRISQSKVLSSGAKIAETNSQMLPQVKFQAGYTRLSNVPAFQVQTPFSPRPIKISDVIPDNYNLKLSLQQPVFTGFRLSSLKNAAELNNKAVATDYTKDINEAAFKIQSYYWQYYKAMQLLKLLNENLVQNQKHLEDTRNNLANGLVTRNDVLKLEVVYSNTKLQQIEATNNTDIARIAFNQALGLQMNAPTEIEADNLQASEDKEAEVYKYEDIIKEAKENRGELQSLKFRLDAGNEVVNAAKSGWMPLVFLNANYYYNQPNSRYQPPVNQFRDSWDVGMSLSWDVWNWGYTSSQTVQAEQNALQTETLLSQLNEAVELEVYSNYLTYQRAFEKITVSRQTVEQAKENYRIINDKYNQQLSTSTDIIDAGTLALQAETNYNNAIVDYAIARTKLEKSIGRRIF
ncbi:MAG: TolC family protein [Ignavibacteria bacterium]